jgi:hypothetical protein
LKIRYAKKTKTKRAHKIAENIGHPDPFSNVVLLFSTNMTAVTPRAPNDKIVTSQIMTLGIKRPISVIIRLRPKDMRRPKSRRSIAF